jgi:cytochrome c oxidase cbb3-type subunit 3
MSPTLSIVWRNFICYRLRTAELLGEPGLRFILSAMLLAASAAAQAQFLPPPAFPGLLRPPGDPIVVDRGRQIYDIHCRACHGADLRGGDMGGPNLLRSPVVLGDQSGEAIGPVIRDGRAPEGGGRPMPPLPLPQADLNAVAEYIHSVIRTAQPQGAPPASAQKPELNLLVGDARRGRRFFDSQCVSCHSASGAPAVGDIAGIGSRLTDIEQLQNSWVTGRRLGPPAPPKTLRRAQVKVGLKSGETVSGTLERLDDFGVVLRDATGAYRSFARRGTTATAASVVVDDPMDGHRRLWPKLTNSDMHDVTAFLATLK